VKRCWNSAWSSPPRLQRRNANCAARGKSQECDPWVLPKQKASVVELGASPQNSLLLLLLLVTKLPPRPRSAIVPKEKPRVNIGEVIKSYRSQRGLSQGDIERRTGLLRCYLSRVENGHTVPSLETLAKIAEAMDISLADFFPGTETPRDRETQKNARRAFAR